VRSPAQAPDPAVGCRRDNVNVGAITTVWLRGRRDTVGNPAAAQARTGCDHSRRIGDGNVDRPAAGRAPARSHSDVDNEVVAA
jgi:hypothetical protein